MSTELAKTTALARIASATSWTEAQVQLVKDTIAKGASDDELMLFLHLARRSGLDPFSRQIYLIERRAQVNGEWKVTRMPQTGIDGFRLIADRTGCYAPGKPPTYEYDTGGHLHTATAYVKKWIRDGWHEVAATAHYDEYVQNKRDGTPNQMWGEKPHIMLAKCAEALALRRAFPAELSGLYTGDEIPGDALPPATVTISGDTSQVIEAEVVSNTEPAPATKKPPTPEGARARFFDKWEATIGARSWSNAKVWLAIDPTIPEPATVAEWAEADRCMVAARERAEKFAEPEPAL